MVIVYCHVCDTPIHTFPYRVQQGQKYCSMSCYAQSLRGSRQDPVRRFYATVEQSTHPSECWLWRGAYSRKRYGVFRINGKNIAAHRFAYIIEHGPIPPGMLVCHSCDNPPCVNQAHLFLGSPSTNSADMVRKNRVVEGENLPHSKLTREDVIRIRAMSPTVSQGTIANLFKVHRTTIWAVIHRKTWKHLLESPCIANTSSIIS